MMFSTDFKDTIFAAIYASCIVKEKISNLNKITISIQFYGCSENCYLHSLTFCHFLLQDQSIFILWLLTKNN